MTIGFKLTVAVNLSSSLNRCYGCSIHNVYFQFWPNLPHGWKPSSLVGWSQLCLGSPPTLWTPSRGGWWWPLVKLWSMRVPGLASRRWLGWKDTELFSEGPGSMWFEVLQGLEFSLVLMDWRKFTSAGEMSCEKVLVKYCQTDLKINNQIMNSVCDILIPKE